MPATMRDLLKDPAYRKYVMTVPRPHPLLVHGDPWQVWVRTVEGRWRTGLFADYKAAWATVVQKVRDTAGTADVTLTSRRVMFAPPAGYDTKDWCPRCRRPSHWAPLSEHHHALKGQIALDMDYALNRRCMFCGIRRSGCGPASQWTVIKGTS